MSRHTMEIPDEIHRWAQHRSGHTNPATWIRDHVLLPAMMQDVIRAKPEEEAPASAKITAETDVSHGTPFALQYPQMCEQDDCKLVIEAGEAAIIFSQPGDRRRHYIHGDHRRRPRDENDPA